MQLPLTPPTRYDLLARYVVTQAGALFFLWCLRRSSGRVRFARWLPAQLTLPGVPERLCDGMAELIDLEHGGSPFAGLVEIQTQPDPLMPGRLLLAGGLCWLTVKPTPLPGDRYELVGIVLNLTGVGTTARSCRLGTAEWTLTPIEINLETYDAYDLLGLIAAGRAPRELLALIPLLCRGGDPGIIARWRELVAAEPDTRRRGDCALARFFAERVGRRPAWEHVMEGLEMVESPMIAEMLINEKCKAVIRVLRKRLSQVPEELLDKIRACTDGEVFDRWLDAAAEAQTLQQFRDSTGL